MLSTATHLPTLLNLCACVHPGRILELGAGWYSTPQLHAMADALNAVLVTLETDHEWADRFEEYRDKWHTIHTVAPEVMLKRAEFGPSQSWDLAFVDHGEFEYQGGYVRSASVKKLLDSTLFVVVHDANEPAKNGYVGLEQAFERAQHLAYDQRWDVWTAVLSNKQPIPTLPGLVVVR